MYDALRNALESDDFTVIESFEIPGQPARYAAIPNFLIDSPIGQYLDQEFAQQAAGNGALWQHQARALNALGSGDNVVISTGTASGKSLVFQSLAFHKVLLNPDSRVLIFYPLKALAADQLRGWQRMANFLELGEDAIGRIDGSVRQHDREDILERAKIVIMTPDVCQAWLMHRLSAPVVKDFVRSLSIVVMDEAHTLEGVFGSNFAFLIRRIIAARNHLLRDDATPSKLQLVAATATIANPGEHMKLLTGADFTVVSYEDDGAPQGRASKNWLWRVTIRTFYHTAPATIAKTGNALNKNYNPVVSGAWFPRQHWNWVSTFPICELVEVPQRPDRPEVRRSIAASALEPSADADAWDYAWWNRATQMYEDPPDEEDDDEEEEES